MLARQSPDSGNEVPGVTWPGVALAVLVATAGCAAVSAVARGSVRNLLRRRDPPGAGWQPAPWHPVQQAGVAFAVLAGALVGAVSILGGIHALTTIPQDWDG